MGYKAMPEKEEKEMGGTLGAAAIIIFSHLQVYYMWFALQNKGYLWLPDSAGMEAFFAAFQEKCVPDQRAVTFYMLYFFVQLFLAEVMPGMTLKGLEIAKLKGNRLDYLCNGYVCFYSMFAIVLSLHLTGIWQFQELSSNFGQYMTVAVIWGDLTSVFWYAYGLIGDGLGHNTGSPIYDFFMGTVLYPRIGKVDVKMVAEARWSWLTLFLITLSHCVKQYEEYGEVSYEMAFMLMAHWLYANACVKGEHFIISTYDMTTESYGWMLNFWNIAGVPFVYCFSSVFLSVHPPMNSPLTPIYFVFYLGVYYVWDVANYQKNDLRLKRQGKGGEKARARSLFPVLPGSRLENPKTLKTDTGVLLVDGMQLYARKIHYTMDILIAFMWGAVTHFHAFLPFFYCCFFTGFIFHRYQRDDARCQKKYGKYWDEYKKIIPYAFVPYVF